MYSKFIQVDDLEKGKMKIRECRENSDMSCELVIEIPSTCLTFWNRNFFVTALHAFRNDDLKRKTKWILAITMFNHIIKESRKFQFQICNN
jgi:hypothetical protein